MKTKKLKLTNTQAAYLAGLIDSDGHISITNHRARGYVEYGKVTVAVTNCNHLMMDWIMANVNLGSVNARRGQTERWRTCYVWRARNRMAEQVLNAILPYLVIKKKQAELALKVRSMKRWGGYKTAPLTESEIAEREEIRLQVKKLNQRGVA